MAKVRELQEVLANFDPEAEFEFGVDENEGAYVGVIDSDGIKNVIGWRAFENLTDAVEAEPMNDPDEYAEQLPEPEYEEYEEYEDGEYDVDEFEDYVDGPDFELAELEEEDLDGLSDEELEEIARNRS
jgi:hypothetical protein